MIVWNEHLPIYIQIAQRLTQLILDGTYPQGAAVPSVRAWAAELMVNPITVTRAYQELADRNIVHTKRGLGMFVAPNAQQILLEQERTAFLTQEWPQVLARLQQLDLPLSALPTHLEAPND